MRAEAFGPTCWASGLASESELSRRPQAQHGLVPKLCPHGGKNTALRAKKPMMAVRGNSVESSRMVLTLEEATKVERGQKTY